MTSPENRPGPTPRNGRSMSQRTPRRAGEPLTAGDIMIRKVITVQPDTPVDRVSELFQVHNINGAPVVDQHGTLLGIITEEDLMFGQMGFSDGELDLMSGKNPLRGDEAAPLVRLAKELMTSHPIIVQESTSVDEICRLIWRLKIHRVPVVKNGKVTGIVSSVDICRLIAEGVARLVPAGD